jgi:Glutathione peroxidase
MLSPLRSRGYGQRDARQILASCQQSILKSFVVRFRVRRAFAEMIEVLAGHLCRVIVASRQPSLCSMRLIHVVGRAHAAHLGRHPAGLQRIRQIGGQEPGTADDIAETAQHHYGATFPITAKAEVRGPNSHPFYKWAIGQRPLDPPRWNFHKYLIGRDGLIAGSFASEVEPTDPRVIAAIDKQLVG